MRCDSLHSAHLRSHGQAGIVCEHLIDPRSGRPGGEGLAAVTVVGPDPAAAEVWSKVLFLAGRAGIAAEAARRRVAACWTALDGSLDMSPGIERFVVWRRP